MKKLFFGVLTFAIISFSITGILITMKNYKNIGHINEKDKNNSGNISENNGHNSLNQNNDSDKEKTIDLYGTYDQNDLIIESKKEQIKFVASPISIPSISGLKNKEVENKINNDIKEHIVSKFNEDINKYTQVGHIDSYVYTYANFANVISIKLSLSYKENDQFKSEEILFNYELVHGEKLEFEDLFVKDVDMYEILRKALYKMLASNDVNASLWSSSYYDKESGEWKIGIRDYEQEEFILNEIQYIPEVTEHDVNKMIKSFMNREDKKFYFTPTEICMEVQENTDKFYLKYVSTKMEDAADDIVIYNKYLTKESLYLNSDVGIKNVWTCADLYTSGYYETGFAEDNLYYEIFLNAQYESGPDYPYKESLQILKDRDIEKANKILEEYKQIARNNPDKFYIATVESDVWYDYNYNNQFLEYKNDEKYYNLISNGINSYIGYVDIKQKKDTVKDIIQSAREHNFAGYLQYFITSSEFEDLYGGSELGENSYSESFLYDARTLLERTSVESIFKKNVDFISVLKAEVIKNFERYSDDKTQQEINEILKNVLFKLKADSIEVRRQDTGEFITNVQFHNIDNDLVTLYDKGDYILSKSSARKIKKSEIQNLTLDELNKAYNEIFARHGHEFKNVELKEYFNNLSWYYPIANKTVSTEELNEFEKYNLDIIKSVISEKKNI